MYTLLSRVIVGIMFIFSFSSLVLAADTSTETSPLTTQVSQSDKSKIDTIIAKYKAKVSPVVYKKKMKTVFDAVSVLKKKAYYQDASPSDKAAIDYLQTLAEKAFRPTSSVRQNSTTESPTSLLDSLLGGGTTTQTQEGTQQTQTVTQTSNTNTNSRFSFTGSSNLITYDSQTGLKWQSYKDPNSADYKASYNTGYTWDNANTYCNTLTLDGLTGWRLPEIEELLSLVDYKKEDSPTINATYFTSQSNGYWSSTTWVPNTTYAWGVSFIYGGANSLSKTYPNPVRCVH